MPKLHFSKADQEGLLRIAAEKTSSTGWKSDAYAIGVYDSPPDEKHEDLRCIVVFQNIDVRSAEMHFAGIKQNWANRRLMGAFLRYCFHPAFGGFKTIRSPIPEWNRPALVAAIKWGFRIDGRLRASAADGSDAIVFSFDADEYRLPSDARDESPEQE